MQGICIVGSGVSGTIHARALQAVKGVRIQAVVDVAAEPLRAFADRWKVPSFYTNLEDALADPAVQAVHLCTPPFLHEQQALLCAQAGKHVLVEKPLARNLREADAIIACCEAAGVMLGAVFQHRFEPLPQAVKAAVTEGRLGRLFLGDAYVKWYRSQEYYDAGGWRATRDKEGGGALINQAIHSIDLLRWLMGPVVEVVGKTATAAHSIETEDIGLALLRFDNGALGVIEGATAVYPGFPERIELHAENGTVVLNEGKKQIDWHLRGSESRVQGEASDEDYARDPAAISTVGHTAQFRDFYAAIAEGRRPAVDGYEGRLALEIIEAIYHSAAAGEALKLPLSGSRPREL